MLVYAYSVMMPMPSMKHEGVYIYSLQGFQRYESLILIYPPVGVAAFAPFWAGIIFAGLLGLVRWM